MFFYYYALGFLLIPVIILAIYAEFKVHSTYSHFSKVVSEKKLTGKEVASLILNASNITNVEIKEIEGTLTDYYDSKNKVLALSKHNYNSSSIASIGVTAHECGHAIQDYNNYFPLRFRHFIVNIYNITSKLLVPLLIIGLIFDFLLLIPNLALIFVVVGTIIFGLSFILNLITLPVEFNASKRALRILEESTVLNQEEIKGAKKVLNSAALTYLAAFLYSLLNFLRFVLIFVRRND